MEIDDIESKIACNELTAAQVFTQMKQHIKECKCTSPLIKKKDNGANVPLDRLVIKPCPFCGCDQIHTYERSWVHPFTKYCRNCRMYGPIADTEAEAIEKWNKLPRAL